MIVTLITNTEDADQNETTHHGNGVLIQRMLEVVSSQPHGALVEFE